MRMQTPSTLTNIVLGLVIVFKVSIRLQNSLVITTPSTLTNIVLGLVIVFKVTIRLQNSLVITTPFSIWKDVLQIIFTDCQISKIIFIVGLWIHGGACPSIAHFKLEEQRLDSKKV